MNYNSSRRSPCGLFQLVFTGTGGSTYSGGAEGASDDLSATPPPGAVIERRGREEGEGGGNEEGSEQYRERRSETPEGRAREGRTCMLVFRGLIR